MEITEKVAYLKGLMEGMELDTSSKEGKLFAKIVDILGDIALAVSDLEDDVDILGDEIDRIHDDFELLDDEDDEQDGADYEGEIYEITCPSCGDSVCIDEDLLDQGEMACPKCGELLEFDLSGALEECDCGNEDH